MSSTKPGAACTAKSRSAINTNIPVMIEQFLNGNIDEAGQMLFDNNPLSIVCSLVCDHEKQCEGHCILGKKGSPVHISSIENYISERFLAAHHPPRPPQNGLAAAIIGSGPAGLTIAIILAQRGYAVTIFESHDRIGGVLRYGIPAFRLPKSILDRYQQRLLELGVRIRPNTTIGGALRMDDLFRDGYSAVFIGTGVWRPNSLGIKGESLGNVHFAIDYLCNPAVYNLGETVSVIGAGNAAIDAARTILRHGARKVTIYARKPVLAASPREVEYAGVDGVDFHNCVRPVEIRRSGRRGFSGALGFRGHRHRPGPQGQDRVHVQRHRDQRTRPGENRRAGGHHPSGHLRLGRRGAGRQNRGGGRALLQNSGRRHGPVYAESAAFLERITFEILRISKLAFWRNALFSPESTPRCSRCLYALWATGTALRAARRVGLRGGCRLRVSRALSK